MRRQKRCGHKETYKRTESELIESLDKVIPNGSTMIPEEDEAPID